MNIRTDDILGQRTLTASMSMTAHEIHHLRARASEVILERLIELMVGELLPVVRDSIKIDWSRVQREVEDALIRRMVGNL